MSTPPSPVVDFAPCFNSARVHAADAPRMQALHRFRFEVYCRELAFLPAADYLDEMESDRHDTEAAHFAAVNGNEELVGYVRLVKPDAELKLPFHARCATFAPALQLPPAADSAEISRLMVRKDYRRRRGDLLAGVAAPTDAVAAAAVTERRNPTPQLMLSLYRALFTYSLDTGLRYWYAAMERPLARALAHMGFAFRQVGPASDYFGMVAPYLADLRELEAHVGATNPDLLRWLRQRAPLTD